MVGTTHATLKIAKLCNIGEHPVEQVKHPLTLSPSTNHIPVCLVPLNLVINIQPRTRLAHQVVLLSRAVLEPTFTYCSRYR